MNSKYIKLFMNISKLYKKNNKKFYFKYSNDILYQILSFSDNLNIENFFIHFENSFKPNEKEELFYLFESLLKYNSFFYPSKEFIENILNKNLYEFYDLCKLYKRIPPSLSNIEEFCDIFNNIFYIFNYQFQFNYENDIQINLYDFDKFLYSNINEFQINNFNKNFEYIKKNRIFNISMIKKILKNFELLFILEDDVYLENIDKNIINNIYVDNKILNLLKDLYINKKITQKNVYRDVINNYFSGLHNKQFYIKNKLLRIFDLSIEFSFEHSSNLDWINFISDYSKNNKIHIFQDLYFYLYLTIKHITLQHPYFNYYNDLQISYIYTYDNNESIIQYKLPKVDYIKYQYFGDFNIIKNNIKEYKELFKFLRVQYLENYIHFSKKHNYYFLLKNLAYFILT